MTGLRRLSEIPGPALETPGYGPAPPHEIRVLKGPIIADVTYQSHEITLYCGRPGVWKKSGTARGSWNQPRLYMAMRHGAGKEFFEIASHIARAIVDSLLALDDLTLYAVLYTIYETWTDGEAAGEHGAKERIYGAFVEGRLMKRKQRNRTRYDVWIAPPVAKPAPATGLLAAGEAA